MIGPDSLVANFPEPRSLKEASADLDRLIREIAIERQIPIRYLSGQTGPVSAQDEDAIDACITPGCYEDWERDDA
jgi:hypothetical protein